MYQSLRTDPEDSSVLDLFDRILEKGIVLDPWARVALVEINLRRSADRIVVAPERRRSPFIVPITEDGSSDPREAEQKTICISTGFRHRSAGRRRI